MADDNVIRREFQAELTPVGDGRTLDLRIVPYNRPTLVRDAGGPEYTEEWLPGVFDKQIKAANRVWVNVEHEKGFRGVVGKGADFRDEEDAFHGSVRIDEGADGDKALRYVNEGILTGVSLEAVPLKSQRTPEGVVQRVKARLLNVALCRNPAFEDAMVLAVREAPEEEHEEITLPDISRSEQVLAAVQYEPLSVTEIVDRPWVSAVERFDDEQYARSCLVEGVLPVLEPDGSLNRNAMRQAAYKLTQPGFPMDVKAKAARKLIRYYRLAGETPPPALFSIASR